jgi:peptide/nickel transport system substrate-binding protein
VIAVAVVAVLLALSLASNRVAAKATLTETTLRGASASFPDYLDPQLSYAYEGWTAMYDTYIPLLTYRHAAGKAGSEVIPGLAKSLPKITNGGKTYTLFLRKGLRYSSGQQVKASDFETTIERLLTLDSGRAPFYTDIFGAKQFRRAKRGGIPGIVTNDATGKIVIHLFKSRSTFTQELALPFAALVPPNTPVKDESLNPPPATGPYVITSSEPGRGWSYERNPEWDPNNAQLMPDLPDGNANRIQIAVIHNESAEVDEVEEGKLDFMLNPPPVDRLDEVRRRYQGTQFRAEPTLSFYYFWMNTRRAPFNDLKVRQAVNYALDPQVLRRIYGGQLTPSQQILPPGMPGYRKFQLYPHNLAKARRLIAAANPLDREITVWADTESPNEEATVYYAQVLKSLGFRVRLKVVNSFEYLSFIGNPSTPNLDTGWSDWFEDYPHPNDFFEPLFSGASILPTYNPNFPLIDVPALNREIARLDHGGGPIPERRYAALDRHFMKLAPVVPYGSISLSAFVSKAIDLKKVIWNPTFGADLASFQFK